MLAAGDDGPTLEEPEAPLEEKGTQARFVLFLV